MKAKRNLGGHSPPVVPGLRFQLWCKLSAAPILGDVWFYVISNERIIVMILALIINVIK
jgi:hypothetical protein